MEEQIQATNQEFTQSAKKDDGCEGPGFPVPVTRLAIGLLKGLDFLYQLKEIVSKPIRTTRRYQELLDAKDIDAIIVAVPDHWHKQAVVDALAADKDVYCEKPMSHNPASAKKTDRIIQIGAQRTSSVLCAKAKELYEKGAIGDLNLVEATYGRNDPNGAS